MPLEEERLLRLKQQRSKEAIDLAMQGRWQEAVAANRAIIDNFPKDVEAYNRLGRAYMELGDYAQAKEAYNHAIEMDPYNSIARKNMQRLNYLKEAVRPGVEPDKVEPQHFIKEIGKAGVVSLNRLATKEVLAGMSAGDKLYLKVDGPNLMAENSRGEYLGLVEPKHALRLIKLMEGGNRYSSAVVSSAEDRMTIIIREEYQDPGQAGRLSFPSKGLAEFRPNVSERVFKVDLEYEEGEDESGYTIVGGGEIEVLPEESADDGDEITDDEV